MDGIASVNGSKLPLYYWRRHGEGVVVVANALGRVIHRFSGTGAATKAEKMCGNLLTSHYELQKRESQ